MASAASSAARREDAALRLQDLSVTLDDGTAVVDDADVEITPGETRAGRRANRAPARARWCARSPACGRGATALIEIRSGAKLFLLPQRPYIPIGTLAARRDLS